MTPIYLNPQPSPFSVEENKEGDHHQHLKLLFNSPYQSSSSSLSTPPTFFNSNIQDDHNQRGTTTVVESQDQHDLKDDKPIWEGGSSSYSSTSSCVQPMVDVSSSCNNDSHEMPTHSDKDEEESKSKSKSGSVKWMSSKMRLMQKMMNPDDDHNIPCAAATEKRDRSINETEINFCFNSNNTVRVCSDCNTTTTPLWRSGPRGPKSLCNACGIRQRKARRAMSEAAAAANVFVVATDSASISMKNTTATAKVFNNKEKKQRGAHVANYKSKCKLVDTTTTTATSMISTENKLCSFKADFGFATLKDKSAPFQGVFPQDVAEAAILLMELSCGLIQS